MFNSFSQIQKSSFVELHFHFSMTKTFKNLTRYFSEWLCYYSMMFQCHQAHISNFNESNSMNRTGRLVKAMWQIRRVWLWILMNRKKSFKMENFIWTSHIVICNKNTPINMIFLWKMENRLIFTSINFETISPKNGSSYFCHFCCWERG